MVFQRGFKMRHVKSLAFIVVGALLLSGIGSVALNVKINTSKTCRAGVLQNEGKLPYYLDGTILDGSKRVVVTLTGEPPEGLSPDLYDMVISYREEDAIIENARAIYIEKYGIDPCESEPNIVDKFSPIELWVLSKIGVIDVRDALCLKEKNVEPLCYSGPHAVDGKIKLLIFFAADEEHKPKNPGLIREKAVFAMDIFTAFKVETSVECYYGVWDASDAGMDIIEILRDFEDDSDVNAYLDKENKFAMGWVSKADRNGVARLDGFYCIGAEMVPWNRAKWPLESIVQHEVSHLFNVLDHGEWWMLKPRCIMTYFWAWISYNRWCVSCYNVLYNEIWEGNPP
jgi:hypothetical protein